MFSSSSGTSRALVTETLASGVSWVAPATTSRIEAASGRGGDGSPEFNAPVSGYNETTTGYYYTAATGQTAIVGQSTEFVESSFVPGDYCGATTTYGNGDQYYTCYTRVAANGYHYYPADNGANTTLTGPGLSLTFPGGQGQAASTTNYGASTVTPGGSYMPSIAGGGFLTISYYK